MTRWTTTTRSRPSERSRTSSPARPACAGLTRTPLTLTCPARQAPDAAERVLASRTDQIQLSTRPASSPATQQTVMRSALAGSVLAGEGEGDHHAVPVVQMLGHRVAMDCLGQ